MSHNAPLPEIEYTRLHIDKKGISINQLASNMFRGWLKCRPFIFSDAPCFALSLLTVAARLFHSLSQTMTFHTYRTYGVQQLFLLLSAFLTQGPKYSLRHDKSIQFSPGIEYCCSQVCQHEQI